MKDIATLNTSIAFKKIEFKDKDTGENVEVILNNQLNDRLSTGVEDVEKYLQIMFSKYKEDGNIDENANGYLDANELIYSKRFATSNNENEIMFSSLNQIMKDEKQAIELANEYLNNDEYFKSIGAIDGKVLISRDFAEFLSMDENMDTIISEKESFLDLEKSESGKGELGLRLAELLLEKLKAWAEEEKRKVMSGITNGSFSTKEELQKQNKVIDSLLKNENELDSLSENKHDIVIKQANELKVHVEKKEQLEVSLKYSDTQADNAKIFSIKG